MLKIEDLVTNTTAAFYEVGLKRGIKINADSGPLGMYFDAAVVFVINS